MILLHKHNNFHNVHNSSADMDIGIKAYAVRQLLNEHCIDYWLHKDESRSLWICVANFMGEIII